MQFASLYGADSFSVQNAPFHEGYPVCDDKIFALEHMVEPPFLIRFGAFSTSFYSDLKWPIHGGYCEYFAR